MSGRHLNRIRQQAREAPADLDELSESSTDEESGAPSNPFDLLNDNEDAVSAAEGAVSETEAPPVPKAVASIPKKSRRGKGRKSSLKGANEDIDTILKELNIEVKEEPDVADDVTPSSKPFLAVETRYLDATLELRRRFGSGAIAAVDDEDEAGQGGVGRRQRKAGSGERLRRGKIIVPRDHWPRFDGGIYQELVTGRPGGPPRFTLRLTSAYSNAQLQYEESLAGYDHNAIPNLLYKYPYLPDALLTMHDVHMSLGETDAAEDVLERCVYGLEQAWRPGFLSAISGEGYVPVDDSNIAQFTALFRYARSLSRRGLARTALEVTKLLLSLNEEDPAGALLCVDYYALRAKEYDFVESLVAEHAMQSVSTALIPGLAFSRAMAARLKAEQGSRQRPRGQGGRLGEPSNEGMAASALPSPDEMLQAAVMMFPATIPRLLTRLVEAGMRDEGWWSGVRMSAPFVDCEPVASTSLDRLLTIFIERHHLLWKSSDALEFLGRACRAVVRPGASALGLSLSDWHSIAAEGWPASNEDSYAHLRRSDYSDTVERLPQEEVNAVRQLAREQERADDVGVDIEAIIRETERLAELEQRGELTAEELERQGPLLALLQTLMPWANAAGGLPNAEGPGRE